MIGSIVQFSQEFWEDIDTVLWQGGNIDLSPPDKPINGPLLVEKGQVPTGFGTVIGHYDWVKDQFRDERYIVDFPEWPYPVVCHISKIEVFIPNCYKNKDLAYKVQ